MQRSSAEFVLSWAFPGPPAWSRLLIACAVSVLCASLALAEPPSSSAARMSATQMRRRLTALNNFQASRFSKGLEIPTAALKPLEQSFGLQTTFAGIDGVGGQRIIDIEPGSTARGMRLSSGDVVVAVNGIPLSHTDSWNQALQRAARLGGWLTLKVRQAGTGEIAYRTGKLQPIRDN